MAHRILLAILLVFTSQVLKAQEFTCSGDFILTLSQDADSSDFYFVDIQGTQTPAINFDLFSEQKSPYLNAIGYRRGEDMIYGIANNTQDLFQVDATGTATFIQHYEALDAGAAYNAGDITPDGRYLIVLSGETGAGAWRSKSMLIFDLESPDYDLTIIPLVTDSGNEFYSLDIAFDPISTVLYGYDGRYGRLVTIDVNTGDVDDTSFPEFEDIEAMAALFFDSFGNLYGYAKHLNEPGIKALYQIDKSTGAGTFLLEGPLAAASDGCNCPYRIEMLLSTAQKIQSACSEISYTFTLANSSELLQEGVRLECFFPPAFTILDVIDSPYGGNIAGIGSNELVIDNMSIQPNIDSFTVVIAVGDAIAGTYATQASLLNLPPEIGYTDLSDDPTTIPRNDSTRVEIIPLEVPDERSEVQYLCPNTPLFLDATLEQGAFSYIWEDGTTGPILEVSSPGFYQNTATNACESVSTTIEVLAVDQSILLDLGGNQTLALGDMLFLDSNLAASIYNYQWSSIPEQILSCVDCSQLSEIVTQSATYYLEIVDEYGCQSLDSVYVEVLSSYDIFAPNVITPNGDGKNDDFFLQGKTGTIIRELSIYDRWGTLVHQATGNNQLAHVIRWEAIEFNQEYPMGVYIWTSKVQFADGTEKLLSGDFTLIR